MVYVIGPLQLYKAQEQFDKAEPLYQRALRIFEKAFGPEYHHVEEILNNLAELYRKQGRNTEAEQLEKRAQNIASRRP